MRRKREINYLLNAESECEIALLKIHGEVEGVGFFPFQLSRTWQIRCSDLLETVFLLPLNFYLRGSAFLKIERPNKDALNFSPTFLGTLIIVKPSTHQLASTCTYTF
ncbi:unnamed protein product, partial [Cuscuta epithymum]